MLFDFISLWHSYCLNGFNNFYSLNDVKAVDEKVLPQAELKTRFTACKRQKKFSVSKRTKKWEE
jgi:hypothetical protein